ncbi:MAG: hypothetical protein II480_02820 [Bacteroidales bacterium]|nr:hypothetical protein [Bacteroidales bacterium]
MKKQLLLIAAIALLASCSISAKAQTFKPSGKTAEELSTEEITNKAEGDFNKDGVKDLFISNNSGSAFYFGKAGGGYNLFHDYDLRLNDKAKVTVNANGVLRIQNDIESGSDIFLFRYQNGGFELIGGKKDRHKSEHYDESYNFSTRKVIKTNGEGASKTTENGVMPLQPDIKFGWIPLKWDMLDFLFEVFEDGSLPVEQMTIGGIYRRMQDDEMLHWVLCDIESYYGRAIPGKDEDGDYHTFGIYEAPGSYNMDTDVTIHKLSGDKYKIVLNETSQDRSYESQINEDGSNLDDLDIPDEEKSTTIFIFDDGKFIEQ